MSTVGTVAVAAAPGRCARRPAALLLNGLALVIGIGIWWGLNAAGYKVPSPPEVAHRAGTLLADGTLESDTWASLRRVLSGFALGTLTAVPVGFLMGWYPPVRALLEPWVQFFRTVPPLATLPLVVALWGIGEQPKVFVIFLASFLACVVTTLQGVLTVERTLIDAARVLGARDLTLFWRVVVPASTPYIFVGMRIGLGSAWATLVAAELIAAQQGLGYRMQNAQLYFDLPTIYVGFITIGILGLLLDRLLLLVERACTSWQEVRR